MRRTLPGRVGPRQHLAAAQTGSRETIRGQVADSGAHLNRKTGTLFAAILGTGVVFLDSTVVNVALQRIGQDLPSSFFGVLEGESYVYNAYLLSLSALLILAGALADAYGRRRFFRIGLIGFGGISMLCGLAPNMESLIVLRIAQGAAGALLVPGSLALLTSTFEGPARGRAFGLWAAAASATSILGPIVGGVLVQTLTWRAVFFINIPIILVALWALRRYVQESSNPDAARRFDWLGAAVVALAVGGLSFGAIYGQQHDWQGPVGPVAIVIGLAAAVAFVVLMARGTHPLVPLGLFRSRNFSVTNLSTLLIYGALYVIGYQQAIFSQGTLGYSPVAAGFISTPGALFLIFLSSRMGSLGARFGPRRFMTIGPIVMAAGILWLTRLPADSAPWNLQPGNPASWIPSSGYLVDFLPSSILFGLGLAITVAPLDDRAHDVSSRGPGGPGLRDQQRDLQGWPAACRSARLRRRHGRFLRRPVEPGARPRYELAAGPAPGSASQPAGRIGLTGRSRGRVPVVDRFVPPRHGDLRGAAGRGRGGQRHRHPGRVDPSRLRAAVARRRKRAGRGPRGRLTTFATTSAARRPDSTPAHHEEAAEAGCLGRFQSERGRMARAASARTFEPTAGCSASATPWRSSGRPSCRRRTRR